MRFSSNVFSHIPSTQGFNNVYDTLQPIRGQHVYIGIVPWVCV
jgi:hypothetical protein